jgi:hemolysin activation/secretion protein
MCCALCCAGVTAALADTLPSAGHLQQVIQTERAQRIPAQAPISSMPLAQTPAMSKGGATVTVSKFNWVGNTLLSDPELNRLTASFLGRPMDFAQLEAVAMAVANHYRSTGYVVQTKLPPQDIANGVVTIEITEAKFGKVLMDSNSSKRVDAARIRETIYAFQPTGGKLNANNIDRALAVLSDLAGIRVQGQFLPSAETGQTDFMVSTQDLPAWTIDTAADNAGARSTGAERATLGLTVNSPLRMGDQLTAHAMVSKGSDYLRAAYRWPLGHAGWTMGINGSRLNYRSTLSTESAGVVTQLHLTGRADAVGLESSYPLASRKRYKLQAVLGWDFKQYENQRDAQVDSSYDTRALNAGLQGQLTDLFAGGGFSTWQMMGTSGVLKALQGNLNEGSYRKLKYSFTRTQELTPRWSLHAALNGQASKTNLDASEKFYLGGMNGVRAYPSSEAGGSVGQLFNLEWRHRFINNSTWFVFYDHGQVMLDPSSTAALNKFALKGYGLGYGHVSAKGINLKAMVARRLGHNPNPTATGQDQDGSLVLNRFWLSASLPF